MAFLFGRHWSKEEILKRVGDISQICGTKAVELQDGYERGVLAIDFWNGSGLRFTVLASRGMDISYAEYLGIPLAWISPTKAIHPAFYEPEGFNWLRGFYGGLLVTCGLSHAGWPAVDDGKSYGLHGRASYIPASNLSTGGYWDGDDYIVYAEGMVREACVFGENLSLLRRIEMKMGDRRIFAKDLVKNDGFEPAPLMLIYHCNLGFPIVDEGSRLIAPSIEVIPRDEIAKSGANLWDKVEAPQHGYKEQVFFHTLAADENGQTVVAMVNDSLLGGDGLGVYFRFNINQFPRLIQWKMVGEGTYVIGIEPTNLTIVDRIKAKEQGQLPMLQPMEEREFRIEIGILHGSEEIRSIEEEIAKLRG
ncbi:MAG: hypothetical protein GDYSWBUE_002110 [Candidatus Fervidibacterota bacterium]